MLRPSESLIVPLLIASLPLVVVTILVFTLSEPPPEPTVGAPQEASLQASRFPEADRFVWCIEEQRWKLLREHEEAPPNSSNQRRSICVWPEDDCAGQHDRIIDQLQIQVSRGQKVIKIFPAHAMAGHFQQQELDKEEDLLDTNQCLDGAGSDDVSCRITYNLEQADVVIYPNADVIKRPKIRQRKDQVWIAYLLESPPNTFPERYERLNRGRDEFNWTASYRSDSDIVTPYAKFVPYYYHYYSSQPTKDDELRQQRHEQLIRGKKKKVAWFASNCHTPNRRLEFAQELSKHIQVDIYGKCGSLNCDKWNQTGCLEMLNRDYKFYLSMENSNSPEYITEKLFRNALGENNQNYLVLPIVMGPPRDDYERLVPGNSFIHVRDDFSRFVGGGGGSVAEKLAKYLKLLDSDDALYQSYFSWKTMGRFVDTKFMCRVCLLAHEAARSGKTKTYPDLKGWFRANNHDRRRRR